MLILILFSFFAHCISSCGWLRILHHCPAHHTRWEETTIIIIIDNAVFTVIHNDNAVFTIVFTLLFFIILILISLALPLLSSSLLSQSCFWTPSTLFSMWCSCCRPAPFCPRLGLRCDYTTAYYYLFLYIYIYIYIYILYIYICFVSFSFTELNVSFYINVMCYYCSQISGSTARGIARELKDNQMVTHPLS